MNLYFELMLRTSKKLNWEDEEPKDGNYDLDFIREEFRKRFIQENKDVD